MVPLFVALTVLAFVALDAFLSWRRDRAQSAAKAAARPLIYLSPGRFLHPTHTWANILPFGRVRLGIDSVLSALVGDHSKVIPLEAGTKVERGDTLFTVKAGSRVMSVPSPLTGTVETVNADRDARESEDWICVINPEKLGTEIHPFYVAEVAANYLRSEWRRAAEWLGSRSINGTVPALPDGGEPARGALGHLTGEDWKEFQQEFLTPEKVR